MSTQELIEAFDSSHRSLMDYVGSLNDEAFAYSHAGKWTAGQQLNHVALCLKPIAQALASKDYIRHTFGTTDGAPLTYEAIVERYKAALDSGGKAPERFVPGEVDPGSKAALVADFAAILSTIRQQLAGYTDEELDTLVLPHPLLGMLTIRELIYLMTYHALHHQRQAEQYLAAGSQG